MNIEAFSTLKGQKAGDWMARALGAKGLIAIDESTTIKNHKAKRTKALMKIATGFKYRRLLTGSPITKSPLDIYAQTEFLSKGLLGYDSFYAFQGGTLYSNVEPWAHTLSNRFSVIGTWRN